MNVLQLVSKRYKTEPLILDSGASAAYHPSHGMKINLWQWEYDFDKEDAKIVVPLILLLLDLTLTPLRKDWLIGGAAAYYLLYFFLPPILAALNKCFARIRHWWIFRCPYCKSREVFLQGYQGYHSDEQYAIHLCNRCRETSVLIDHKDTLIAANPEKVKAKLTP
jgi:hypothetical protein